MADLDIGSILSSLSSDDINNLKNMANSILGGNTDSQKSPEEPKTQNNSSTPFPDLSSLGLPDMYNSVHFYRFFLHLTHTMTVKILFTH